MAFLRRKILWAALIIIIAVLSGVYIERARVLELWRNARKPGLPPAMTFEQVNTAPAPSEPQAYTPPEISKTTPQPKPAASEAPKLSESINLAVPFTSQAPNADWGQPYQDACEEASLAMVHYFYAKKTFTPADADREILDIMAFEERRFDYGYDITAEEAAIVAKNFYGYKRVEVVYDPTVDAIKNFLAKGLPVAAPVYGRALGNPYFTPPGPTYHMLAIKGYTKDSFITNDPGTRRGADYIYPFQTLMDAIHDFNGGDVERGRKAIIIIYPN